MRTVKAEDMPRAVFGETPEQKRARLHLHMLICRNRVHRNEPVKEKGR